MLNLLRSLVTASAVVFLTLSTAAQAFVLLPTPPASGFVMNFNLLPTSQFNTIGYGSQSWNSLAQSAVDAWNQVGIGPGMDHNFFLVRVPTVIGNPCTRDGVNEVRRAADFCGMSFGSALAIAQSWSINGVRVEVDIVFNNTKSWDAYPGALRSAGGGGTLLTVGLQFATGGQAFNTAKKFLWVESNPTSVPGGHLRGINGLTSLGLVAGIHFDAVNAAALASVNFANYEAIAIASSFGGLLSRAELDALIARSADI